VSSHLNPNSNPNPNPNLICTSRSPSNPREILTWTHFVHDYYSVERFKIAYSGTIPTMTDKSQWPKVSLGFKLRPPKLKIGPGRKRKNRFKASHEPGARKLEKSEICGEVGQHDPSCSVPKKR